MSCCSVVALHLFDAPTQPVAIGFPNRCLVVAGLGPDPTKLGRVVTTHSRYWSISPGRSSDIGQTCFQDELPPGAENACMLYATAHVAACSIAGMTQNFAALVCTLQPKRWRWEHTWVCELGEARWILLCL